MYIKIKHKEVKTCENTNGTKTLVLHLKYKLGDLKGKFYNINHNYE